MAVVAPVAVNIAEQPGVNVDPFFMVVAVGAFCAFLTPIGNQNNTLIMGPAGYKFRGLFCYVSKLRAKFSRDLVNFPEGLIV